MKTRIVKISTAFVIKDCVNLLDKHRFQFLNLCSFSCIRLFRTGGNQIVSVILIQSLRNNELVGISEQKGIAYYRRL